MHIEKKNFDNIFNILMNVSDKTKHNEKARKDLALLANQRLAPLDLALEESIRSRCWAKAIGGKTKGRLYRAGDLARDYQGGDSSLTQKSKASSSFHLIQKRLSS